MRSRTSDWFEIKIRYAKTQEDGTLKNVTEHYYCNHHRVCFL